MTVANPSQLYLEIPTIVRPPNQSYSTAYSRWNAHINQICLDTVLPWLQEEFDPQAKVYPHRVAMPSYWEVVNGVAINLSGTRFVLIPSETIDIDEMRVPQEWIDIPSWRADYYLAVQVEPDEGWVRVWGYATHQQLKTRGNYDPGDRTYSLTEEATIADISVLWVARQLGLAQTTQAEIAPLATLSLPQAENLLQRLGNAAVIEPRLAVPFTLWGALLEHGGWRDRLYQKRLGRPEQRSMQQWLRSGISEIAEQLGWQQFRLRSEAAGARGLERETATSILSRQITIGDRGYELRAIPIDLPAGIWRFELRNPSLGGTIPPGVKLRLLSEDLQPFENNEDVATEAVEQLYIEVAIASGEGIVWEIEPTPEDYDREILRF